jgi:hypothetical protein
MMRNMLAKIPSSRPWPAQGEALTRYPSPTPAWEFPAAASSSNTSKESSVSCLWARPGRDGLDSHVSLRCTRSPHRICFPTATKTSVPRCAMVRRGPGFHFLVYARLAGSLESSTGCSKSLWPGAGLLSQPGAKLLIFGICARYPSLSLSLLAVSGTLGG